MKRLNQMRIDAGYSIADIARFAGVTDATACRWLSGTEQPDIHQQQVLAAAFGVDITELDGREVVTVDRRIDRLRHRLTTTGKSSTTRP